MAGKDMTYTTADGVRLVYDDEGVGSPVVLLHGYSSRRQDWVLQREALLAAGHRVIAVDLRGHGASDNPDHGQRMARLGQDTRELLEQLDLDDVTIMGHSMGVSVALAMFSVSGFDRVTRLVWVDQSPKIVNEEGWRWGVKKVTWDNAFDCVHFRAEWGGEDYPLDLPADSTLMKGWDTFDHASVSNLLLDHFVADWRDLLPRIPISTWVITARHTGFYFVEGMRWVADQIPGSQFTVFENSGHSPHVSEAGEFNRQLLDFLAGQG